MHPKVRFLLMLPLLAVCSAIVSPKPNALDTHEKSVDLHQKSAQPDDPLTIMTSDGTRALVFCSCAKCGSTSAYQFLYHGLYGKEFSSAATRSHTTSIQNHLEWTPRLQTVPSFQEAKLPEKGTTYLGIARDPMARYLSAYKSKLACSGDSVDVTRTQIVESLVSLAAASNLTITPQHSTMTKRPYVSGPCLTFEQYTDALTAIHRAGNEAQLNGHFLPQDVVLKPCAHGILAVASEMELLAPMLKRSYDLHPSATMGEERVSGDVAAELDPASVKQLCGVARREIHWLSNRTRGSALPENNEPLSVANCSFVSCKDDPECE